MPFERLLKASVYYSAVVALTPDYTGNPEGGNDLSTFMTILRTGHDFDRLHPNCGGSVTDNCYDAPVNGAVLQVMPQIPKHDRPSAQGHLDVPEHRSLLRAQRRAR